METRIKGEKLQFKPEWEKEVILFENEVLLISDCWWLWD